MLRYYIICRLRDMPVTTLSQTHIPESLTGHLVVNEHGIPRFWATVWVSLDGAHLAESSLRKKLNQFDQFYNAVKCQTGSDCLDQLISDMEIRQISQALEGFMIQLQNEAVQIGVDRSSTWQSVLTFIKSTLERLAYTDTTVNQFERVHASLLRLNRLFGSLKPIKKRCRSKLRALPSVVVEEVYDLIKPDSPKNPFRGSKNQWRNFLLIILLLHQGLRRGEVLLLTTNAVVEGVDEHTGEIINWINITSTEETQRYDSRLHSPSIKTNTSHRQLPISQELASIFRNYVANWRGKLPHPFVFTNNLNAPLSMDYVNRLFNRLSEYLSDKANQALINNLREPKITPHDLRHTCAVVRLSQFIDAGMEMDLALQKMRAFFGWSLTSDMPRFYARAYFESRLETVWHANFDTHVKTLRQLEFGQR